MGSLERTPGRPAPEPDQVLVAGAAEPPDGPYDADVIILAVDRPDETVAAIRSALMQRGVSRHVFVVDQGSRPPALERIAAAVDGRRDTTLIRLARNQGVPGGRNRAAALGHGRVIVALDNDAEFASPDTLASLVAALDAEPGLAAIGCRILDHATGGDDPTSWGYPRALLPRAAERFDATTFVGAGHAIRRAAWDAVGEYDASLFFCWEEYDWCLRAIARGWRIGYRGDIEVRHKVSGEQRVAWSGRRWFHYVRNRLYIERKYGAPWIALLPRYGAYVVKGLRNGHLSASIAALPAACRMARQVTALPLPAPARAYLRRHDAVHRGTWRDRLSREVLAAFPCPVRGRSGGFPPVPRGMMRGDPRALDTPEARH